MNIKTLTAPTIQEALAEARHLLGDDVVLLESVDARDGQLARITVMTDEPLPTTTQPATRPQPELAFAGAAVAPAYGYATSHRPSASHRLAAPQAEDSAAPRYTRSSPPSPRARLFPTEPAPAPAPPPAPAFDASVIERLLDDRLRKVHERLDGLEQAGGAMLNAVQRWAAHPLFGELLEQGMRPETADRLFRSVVERGFRSDDRSQESQDELRWAIAQELRQLLAHTAASQRAAGPVVFIGPGGAGKTTLLLKLATNPSYYGRLRTAVLVIEPEDADELPYQAPTDLYRRFGLAVLSARTAEDVRQALDRTAGFDQLLIDTPPMPVRAEEAQQMLRRVQDLLREVVPLDVHLVLDAARALDGFDTSYLSGLPLRPTAASLTRLDEAFGWGRVADWLLALDLPVRFVSTGPRVPDSVSTFSPGWFVEELAQLAGTKGTTSPRRSWS